MQKKRNKVKNIWRRMATKVLSTTYWDIIKLKKSVQQLEPVASGDGRNLGSEGTRDFEEIGL
jgi:hypothetical protein